ncbi:MAG: hypothetical protein GX602_08345 [Dehalococcoidales bacterium]|nr:hypothetical protein [Dehalococcoidales bacterium]
MINRMATVCASIFIAMALFIAWLNPATGYELDIYASTPLATWLLIGASMIIGAGIILHQLFTQGYKHNRAWMLGFAVLVVARLALLWVPYARGYVTWGGDNITHWGMIIDVLDTGHLYSENSYPVAHSMLAQVIQLTGLPIGTVTNLSTGLFSIYYLASIFLLVNVVTPWKKHLLIVLIIASFSTGFGIFLTPNGWSIIFLPFLFYLFYKKYQNPPFAILFVTVLILYPFFHPLSSLMVAISFGIILLVESAVYYYQSKRANNQLTIYIQNNPLTAALLQITILIPWILSFNKFIPNIRNMWAQITAGAPSQFGRIEETLAKINMTGWNTVILYVKLYGVATILILISVAGIILLLRRALQKNEVPASTPLLSIGAVLMFFGFLYFLYLVGFPGMSSIGGDRHLSYLLLFAPILGGYAIRETFIIDRYKRLFATASICLLAIIPYLTFQSLYQAPYRLQPNGQITAHSIAGSEWNIENKNPAHKSACIMSPIHRYADGIMGKSAAASRPDLSSSGIIQVEDHLGYSEYDTLGEQYSEEILLNITIKDRVIYDTVWEVVDRFNEDDFIKLAFDPSVHKLYDNNEFASYYIEPIIHT